MIAVTCFFTTALVLGLHGAEILSASNPGKGQSLKYGVHESIYFRDTISYSIGEIGIHRLGWLLAINAAVWSAICIILSGPFWTQGWPYFYNWYLSMPIWSAQGFGA